MVYILMLVSAVATLTSSSLMNLYVRKHASGNLIYLTILTLFAALFFLVTDLVTDKAGFIITPKVLLYGLIACAFYCSAYFLTFVAYASGSFVLTNLIITYSLVMPIGYGLIFLGDKLSVFGIVGIAVMIVSLFLINFRGKQERGSGGFSWKWLLATVLCSIGNGAIAIIRKMQQLEFASAYDNEYTFVMIGVSCLIFLIASLIKEKDEWKHFFSLGRLYAAGSGVCNGLTNLVGLIVNGMMILSLVTPLMAGVNIVMNFLASKFIFKEKMSVYQIVGTALGALSIVLLSL